MNLGTAYAIFKRINSSKYSDEDKALAIYEVMNMETHNGITKKELLAAMRWLWNRHFVIEQEGGE